jgi:hypothetical protein
LSGVAGGSATGLLTVALRGLNEGTNTVRVWLNGAACPDAVWTGLHQYAYAAPISQAGLLEGTNTVTLSLIGDEETFSRDVLINWFEIAYTRDLTAANGALLFTNRAGGAAAWQVGGFAAADVRVLRVGDTGDVAVAVVTNVTVSGAGPYAAVFADNAPAGAAYALAAANALRRPAACVAEESSNLRSATQPGRLPHHRLRAVPRDTRPVDCRPCRARPERQSRRLDRCVRRFQLRDSESVRHPRFPGLRPTVLAETGPHVRPVRRRHLL